LPFIVYFGQRRSLTEGLILSLFCSHLYSLASGAPIGVFTTHYLILFAVVRGLNYAISADTWISIVSLLLGLSLLARFIITWVAAGFGHGWPLFSWANISFGGMFLNAVTGYFLYAWARLLDRWTYKSLAPEIELDGSNL
jgi:hypothetical protein